MSFQILSSLASPRLCHSTWDQMASPRISPSNSDSWEGRQLTTYGWEQLFLLFFLPRSCHALECHSNPHVVHVALNSLRTGTHHHSWLGHSTLYVLVMEIKAKIIPLPQSSWTNGCGCKFSARSSVLTSAIWSSFTVLMKRFAGAHHTDCQQTHTYCVKSVKTLWLLPQLPTLLLHYIKWKNKLAYCFKSQTWMPMNY